MSGAVDAFVAHALERRFETMPAGAVQAAKTFILDSFAVGVAGAQAPIASRVRDAAIGWGAPTSRGFATVWGDGAQLPAPSAAFVNAFQIHCQEFDCVHEPAVVHPMATILAALVTEAERMGGVSGRDLIGAVIIAVDIAAGLGLAARNPIRFFRPATAGLFGATLGVARLRGLDGAMTRDALGQALGQAAGVMQAHVEGKPTLPLQIANAARAAHLACDLAEAGIEGPHDVFEGPFAYLPLFEGDWDLAPVIASLGRTWRITELSHKPNPTGRAAHGGITLMQALRAEGVRAEMVERITLSGPPIIARLVGRPLTSPLPANYARLCFAYVGAVALARGNVTLADFDAARLADGGLHALGAKISVVVAKGSTDPAAFAPQTIRAELSDGRVKEARIEAVYGSPADRMTREAALAKARECLVFGLGTEAETLGEQLLARLSALETETDVAGLARLAGGQDEGVTG